MLRLKYLITACVLALTVSVADANTITYDVSGTFFFVGDGPPPRSPGAPPDTFGPPGTFSGTINWDVTASAITTFDIKFPSLPDFTNVRVLPYGFVFTDVGLISVNTESYLLFLPLPNLLLYPINGTAITFGEVRACDTPICSHAQPYITGISGNVTPAAATPLPSTWLMLLSGFVGLGFFAYRGTKKNAAALAA